MERTRPGLISEAFQKGYCSDDESELDVDEIMDKMKSCDMREEAALAKMRQREVQRKAIIEISEQLDAKRNAREEIFSESSDESDVSENESDDEEANDCQTEEIQHIQAQKERELWRKMKQLSQNLDEDPLLTDDSDNEDEMDARMRLRGAAEPPNLARGRRDFVPVNSQRGFFFLG